MFHTLQRDPVLTAKFRADGTTGLFLQGVHPLDAKRTHFCVCRCKNHSGWCLLLTYSLHWSLAGRHRATAAAWHGPCPHQSQQCDGEPGTALLSCPPNPPGGLIMSEDPVFYPVWELSGQQMFLAPPFLPPGPQNSKHVLAAASHSTSASPHSFASQPNGLAGGSSPLRERMRNLCVLT